MPSFTYKAVGSIGKITVGVIEAEDRRQVVQKLKAQKMRPISITLQKGISKGSSEKTARTASANELKNAKKRLREKTALNFLKMLLQLHGSGMPLGDSIRLLSQRLSDKHQKALAAHIWRDLNEGSTLGHALEGLPEYFNESLVYLVEAGEATGNLAPILAEIVTFLEEMRTMRSKIVGGLSYPILVTIMALGVAVFFLFFLLPEIQDMLETLGGEMSFFARILIGASNGALLVGPFLGIGGIVAGLSLYRWRRTEPGRRRTDNWLLQLPLFGRIFQYMDLFQVSNLMGTLLSSGINTTETLRLAEKTIRNSELRSRFKFGRSQINEGVSLAMAFRNNQFMPDLATDILSVGENTGNLTAGLKEITAYYRNELSKALKVSTNLMSSVALIFAFSLVALVALGIVTSILQVSDNLIP